MIEENQCIIVWFVDDNRTLYVNPMLIEKIIRNLKVNFVGIVITKGRKHFFMCINIDTVKEKEWYIDMKEYTKGVMNCFWEEIGRRVYFPAHHSLLYRNEKSDKLDEERSDNFHSMTARLLYLMKMYFLSTRVSKSDKYTRKNLERS